MRPLCFLAAFALLAPRAHAQGEVIVVDDTPDVADFRAPQTAAQLPGPDGRVTFREAVIAANNTPGPQTILFNVPRSRWWTLDPNRVTIFSDFSPFILTDDSTTVDGRSQTAFTGDTNPDGNEVAFWGQHPNALGSPMIIVHSDGNTFVGLDAMQQRGYGIELAFDAEGNRVIGNTISGLLYAAVLIEGNDNTVGGTGVGEGNALSSGNDGVRLEASFGAPPPTGNHVIGNYLTGSVAGVRVRGGAVGTVIGGPAPEERNVIADAGHYGEEGFPVGDQVAIEDAVGTVVEGNYIGLTADGTASSGQIGPVGVQVSSSSGTVIRGNAIGGIRVQGTGHYQGQLFGWGVNVEGTSAGTVVAGNLIGVGADGQTPVPNLNGVRVGVFVGTQVPTNTTVGGLAPEDANVIAFNSRDGVVVDSPVTGAAIRGNAIFANGDDGIDLGPFGPTPNDVHDPDEGANRLQNHPVLDAAALSGPTLTVTYRVDTAPTNATYPLRVEFFRADADGEEGALFLGADTYTAADYNAGMPGSRTAALDVSGLGLAVGDLVLATATDAAGNTSEFGAAVAVTAGAATVTVDIEPVGAPVVVPASGGSFRYTLTLTNTSAASQTAELWTALSGPLAREPLFGPKAVTLAPGATLTRTLTQRIPAGAPAGAYTYTARVGTFPSAAASDAFAFTKQGAAGDPVLTEATPSRVATATSFGASDWAVSGWESAEGAPAASSAAAGVPAASGLSDASPNPFRDRTRLTLALAEARAVRVEVLDALGRRVALLHDGPMAAGTHTLALDGARLPAGLYLVRVVAEAFVVTRRAVRTR